MDRKLYTVTIVLYFVYGLSTYEISCPQLGHWKLRASSICSDYNKYTCLLDTVNESQVEDCIGPRYEIEGYKTTINRGFFNRKPCSSYRFQPITFGSNGQNNCLFQKSRCSEEGQIAYYPDENSSTFDRTCICDYTNGLALANISQKNKCFCVPSQEDCSCFKKNCQSDEVLTQDYKCVRKVQMRYDVDSTKCMKIPTIDNTDNQFAGINGSLDEIPSQFIYSRGHWFIACITVIILLISIIVISTLILLNEDKIEKKIMKTISRDHSNTDINSTDEMNISFKSDMLPAKDASFKSITTDCYNEKKSVQFVQTSYIASSNASIPITSENERTITTSENENKEYLNDKDSTVCDKITETISREISDTENSYLNKNRERVDRTEDGKNALSNSDILNKDETHDIEIENDLEKAEMTYMYKDKTASDENTAVAKLVQSGCINKEGDTEPLKSCGKENKDIKFEEQKCHKWQNTGNRKKETLENKYKLVNIPSKDALSEIEEKSQKNSNNVQENLKCHLGEQKLKKMGSKEMYYSMESENPPKTAECTAPLSCQGFEVTGDYTSNNFANDQSKLKEDNSTLSENTNVTENSGASPPPSSFFWKKMVQS